MVGTYIAEFSAIVRHLKRQKNALIKGNFLIIEKPKLTELLNRNQYETAENKLLVWRGLKWIDTDSDDRLTKRFRTDEHRLMRAIAIDLTVYDTLSAIIKRQ